jgi:hypothetical protein
MPALVAGIHVFAIWQEVVDGRGKLGHDVGVCLMADDPNNSFARLANK